jgi:hypothetical protein
MGAAAEVPAAGPAADPPAAAMHAEGSIIRVEEGLVWIDLGERNGVLRGDLFDILSAEVVTHPISGDTLAITPKSVGIVRVVQAFDRMSLAEVLQLAEGYDPLLMQVAHIADPEHLAEVERFVQAHAYRATRSGVPPWQRAVPGLYQLRTGAAAKGWALVALEGAAVTLGVAYYVNSQDWYDMYRSYSGSDAGYYDKTYNTAVSRRQWSNRFLWVAGLAYAYHWADALWIGGPGPAQANGARAPALSLAFGPQGEARLQLVGRF